MFLSGPEGRRVALCYSMNVHPGEGLTDVLRALDGTVAPLKARLGVPGPFAVGLRLGARAAEEVEGRAADIKAKAAPPAPAWWRPLTRAVGRRDPESPARLRS